MTENIETIKSVIINCTKDNFLSKNSIKRFKNDLKKCDVKNIAVEDGKYLKEGYIFDINYKNNTFNVKIITLEEHLENEKKKMLKNKIRQLKDNRSGKMKKEMESMKRVVPDKLFKNYMNLMKQYNFSNIPSPKDVMQNPEKFQKQISLLMEKNDMVSNDMAANNAIKRYFNKLGNFMGVEPSDMNLKNNVTQSVEQNIYQENDTDDEEAPDLV